MDGSEELTNEIKLKLLNTVKELFKDNKGILAVDESLNSLGKKFEAVGIDNSVENRVLFRDLLFSTEGIEKFLNGVILNEETFEQVDSNGILLPEKLMSKGIKLGVKVDKGLMNFEKEQYFTVGLDDLENRLKEEKHKDVSFTKWRALFEITEETPTDECIEKNCISICKYADICQRNGLVPIIEPEISFSGNYRMEKMILVAKRIYSFLFRWINSYNLFVPGLILKLSFLSPAQKSNQQIELSLLGRVNIQLLRETIPPAVGGIVFLSGGHEEDETFRFLESLQVNSRDSLYFLSFSFSRSLTARPLKVWGGQPSRVGEAKKIFIELLDKCLKANRKSNSFD